MISFVNFCVWLYTVRLTVLSFGSLQLAHRQSVSQREVLQNFLEKISRGVGTLPRSDVKSNETVPKKRQKTKKELPEKSDSS